MGAAAIIGIIVIVAILAVVVGLTFMSGSLSRLRPHWPPPPHVRRGLSRRGGNWRRVEDWREIEDNKKNG